MSGSGSPPSMLVPASAPLQLSVSQNYAGSLSGPSRHFISPAQFSAWKAAHPSTRLRPSQLNTPKLGAYEAPKGATAQMLHNIPQRRTTSRCNIVDWILWRAANEVRAAAALSVEARRSAENRARPFNRPPAEASARKDADAELVALYEELKRRAASAHGLSLVARAMLLGASPCPMSVSEQLGKGVKVGSTVSIRAAAGHTDKEKWSPAVEKRRLYSSVVEGVLDLSEMAQLTKEVFLPPSPGSSASRSRSASLYSVNATGAGSSPMMGPAEGPGSQPKTNPTSQQNRVPEVLESIVMFSRRSASLGPQPSRHSLSSGSSQLLRLKVEAEEAAAAAATVGPPAPTVSEGATMGIRGGSRGTPHDDYRILYSGKLHTRASGIYSAGVGCLAPSPPLGGLSSPAVGAPSPLANGNLGWCTVHRLRGCSTCERLESVATAKAVALAAAVAGAKKKPHHRRHSAHPGDGLCEPEAVFGGDARRGGTAAASGRDGGADCATKPLAAVLPDFLILSAEILRALDPAGHASQEGEGAASADGELEDWEKSLLATENRSAVSSPLPDDSAASETLSPALPRFKLPPSAQPAAAAATAPDAAQQPRYHPDKAWYEVLMGLLVQSLLQGYLILGWRGVEPVEVLCGVGVGGYDGGRSWSSALPQAAADAEGEDAEEDEEGHGEAERRENERRKEQVGKAALLLFGTRNTRQGDYERTMRDIAHEFLDVGEGLTLTEHLERLNAKYPLSDFAENALAWLDAVDATMGKPELAKYEDRAAAAAAAAAAGATASAASPSAGADDAGSAAGSRPSAAVARYFACIDPDDERAASEASRKRRLSQGVAALQGTSDRDPKRAR